MRISEAAEAAGLTVRALRHYHRIGLLPEPARGGNGYRDYDAADVARLLRIRLLARAGVALSRMPALLEEGGGTDHLAAAETDLTQRIERLQAERELTRLLRDAPSISPFATDAPGSDPTLDDADGVPPSWRAFDATLMIMLLLAAETGGQRERLAETHGLLSSPGMRARVLPLMRAFQGLGTEADAADVDAFVTRVSQWDASIPGPPMVLSGLRLGAVRSLVAMGPFTSPQRTALLRLLRLPTRASSPSSGPLHSERHSAQQEGHRQPERAEDQQ